MTLEPSTLAMTLEPSALLVAGAISLFALSSAGSAIGTGIAASAAVGAWKKCYAHNRPAPFTMVTFVGMPLSNTLYGMIIMFVLLAQSDKPLTLGAGWVMLAMCVFVGLIIGLASITQARAAACACDAQGETGQGLGNYIAAIGIIEGVTLFVFVFSLLAFGKFFTAAPAAL